MRNLCFLVFAALILGCTPRPKPPVISTGAAVAKIGDSVITDQDLLERIAAIEKNFPRVYSTHPQKKKLLDEMINLELLYREALASGLDKRYEFKSRLADLYIQQLAEQARATITDESVRKEYELNRKEYEQISARHILLKTPANASDSDKAAIRKKLSEIRAEAIKDPSQFADLAMKNSQDGSASSGGELGFFSAGMMVAPFSSAAFALKKIGDISPVIETKFGYHIIQLSGDHRDISIHKEVIKDRLLRATQRSRLDAELARLKSEIKTEVYEENLAKLSPLPSSVSDDPTKLVPPEEPAEQKP